MLPDLGICVLLFLEEAEEGDVAAATN